MHIDRAEGIPIEWAREVGETAQRFARERGCICGPLIVVHPFRDIGLCAIDLIHDVEQCPIIEGRTEAVRG